MRSHHWSHGDSAAAVVVVVVVGGSGGGGSSGSGGRGCDKSAPCEGANVELAMV